MENPLERLLTRPPVNDAAARQLQILEESNLDLDPKDFEILMVRQSWFNGTHPYHDSRPVPDKEQIEDLTVLTKNAGGIQVPLVVTPEKQILWGKEHMDVALSLWEDPMIPVRIHHNPDNLLQVLLAVSFADSWKKPQWAAWAMHPVFEPLVEKFRKECAERRRRGNVKGGQNHADDDSSNAEVQSSKGPTLNQMLADIFQCGERYIAYALDIKKWKRPDLLDVVRNGEMHLEIAWEDAKDSKPTRPKKPKTDEPEPERNGTHVLKVTPAPDDGPQPDDGDTPAPADGEEHIFPDDGDDAEHYTQHTVDSAVSVLLALQLQGHGDIPLCMIVDPAPYFRCDFPVTRFELSGDESVVYVSNLKEQEDPHQPDDEDIQENEEED